MIEPIRFIDVPDATPFPGIINKVVLNREKGSAAITVGELRITPGEMLPLHMHKVEEALVLLSGEAVFAREGKEFSVSNRTVVLMPAGTKHSIRNVGKEEVQIIFFFPAVEVERILVEQ
jgi:mannose-6-phosphate isomerase-like protein (cupin superfamily)